MSKILAYKRIKQHRKNVRIFNLETGIFSWQYILVPFNYESDYHVEEDIDVFCVALASKTKAYLCFNHPLLVMSLIYINALIRYKTWEYNIVNEENMRQVTNITFWYGFKELKVPFKIKVAFTYTYKVNQTTLV